MMSHENQTMTTVLYHNSYGKAHVRVTRVTREAGRHDLKELCVGVQLEGDFAATYLHGDNRQVIATDSMKNIVYVLAHRRPPANPESFGETLARHFLDRYAQVSRATIELSEQPWQRICVAGHASPHAFEGGGSERRTCKTSMTRTELRVESGIAGLHLLKTTNSAFAGFVRDEYTTLPEADDRILATELAARWQYDGVPAEPDSYHHRIRQKLLEVFARHRSLSVQQTLYAMGAAALESCAAVEQIHLEMPNQHRILVNLKPFGIDNRNEIFVPTSEPFGLISGTVRRQ